MMSSTTGAEAVCAWSLFSQPHLASLLAVEKGFVGHFFSSFSALSFFFVKQTQQHLEPHVFHGHLTIKSRCCQSHKIIVAEWTLEHMCATRSIIVIMKADFFTAWTKSRRFLMLLNSQPYEMLLLYLRRVLTPRAPEFGAQLWILPEHQYSDCTDEKAFWASRQRSYFRLNGSPKSQQPLRVCTVRIDQRLWRRSWYSSVSPALLRMCQSLSPFF